MGKANIYRCEKHCKNCPFLDSGEKIHLKDGRMDEIRKMLLKNDSNSFNCHKTVYNLDENMNITEEQKPKMCYGAYKFLKEQKKPNIQMRLALSMGIDND